MARFRILVRGYCSGCLERNAVAFEQQYCETIKCVNGFVPDAVVGFLQERPKGSCYSLDASASSSSPPASSLLVRPLTHSDSLTPSENTPRLTHIQTQPHPDSLTMRLTHNRCTRTQTHTQAHPHSDSLTQATRTQRYPHTQPIHAHIHTLRASQGVAARGTYSHSQIIHTQTHPTSSSLILSLIHTQNNPYSCGRHSTWIPQGGTAWEGDTRPLEAILWGCFERGALFGVPDSFAFRAGCEDVSREKRFA